MVIGRPKEDFLIKNHNKPVKRFTWIDYSVEEVIDYEWNSIKYKYDLQGNITHFTELKTNVFKLSEYTELSDINLGAETVEETKANVFWMQTKIYEYENNPEYSDVSQEDFVETLSNEFNDMNGDE